MRAAVVPASMNNPRHPHPQFRSIDVWRRLTSRVRAWCHAVARRFRRPPAGAAGADARYRAYNGWYFAQLGEQERMLADKPRMAFYHAAIARHVQPGDRVIDLGTGTGILAAFAARRGAAKVYAIDHSAILKHARTLAAHNRVRNIDFIATHSQDFRLDERVDVIVHEQMGDWLFDEAMVANITDLRDRLLKPGGRILPSRFEFYCEPVKLRDRSQVPFIWELEVHGYDYSCLEAQPAPGAGLLSPPRRRGRPGRAFPRRAGPRPHARPADVARARAAGPAEFFPHRPEGRAARRARGLLSRAAGRRSHPQLESPGPRTGAPLGVSRPADRAGRLRSRRRDCHHLGRQAMVGSRFLALDPGKAPGGKRRARRAGRRRATGASVTAPWGPVSHATLSGVVQ